MTPIFVPSKNRAGKIKFYPGAIYVVEMQDYDKYSCMYSGIKLLMLPKENQGIAYVRNFIKEYTENNNIHQFWMLDDDISNFYHREGTKMIKDDINVLQNAEEAFMKNNIALGALEYQQFAWSATKPLVKNSFCDVCVWVDNTETYGLRYRHYLEGKEDRDFAMQVISEGKKTARSTEYAFSVPKNGSNAGGLKEVFYDIPGREEETVRRMVETWGPQVCTPITKPDGRRDVSINWKLIGKTEINLFS